MSSIFTWSIIKIGLDFEYKNLDVDLAWLRFINRFYFVQI